MKKSLVFISMLAATLVSCSKENQIDTDVQGKLVPMTFSADLPSTRTVLDGLKVLWTDDDVLNVLEIDSDKKLVGEHPFTLFSGDGTSSATFSGEVVSTENTFIAVYPNKKLYNSTDPVGETIELKNLGQDVDAVENSFDPNMAVMTAVMDESGKLTFRHAMAYIKFTANSSDIASVKVTAAGSGRIYGRPVIKIADGAPSAVNGTSSNSNLTMSGVFVSGSSYYFPITIKPNNKLGELTFLATSSSGKESTLSTTILSDLAPEAGKVYNLGQIPFSFAPVISVTQPAKLEYDATSGSISFTVTNPIEGQSVSASLNDGVDWISDIVVGADAVTFACETNNTNAERSAIITLSYAGADSVPVTITQKVQGSTAEVYDWVFNDWDLETITGKAKDKDIQSFTYQGLSVLARSSGTKWNINSTNSHKYIVTGGNNNEANVESMDTRGGLFKFTTASEGTVTVVYASNGSDARKVMLRADSNDALTDETHVSSSKSSIVTASFESVPAGTIRVYGSASIQVFEIHFSNQ